MKRAAVPSILVAVVLLALGVTADAQQPTKVPRIGLLVSASASTDQHRAAAFSKGLRDLGYVEGQNIAVEYRFAEGNVDELPALAAELVRLRVDIIVVEGGQGVRAAQQASSTIPIIMTTVSDPVALGFAASLAKPGGNITGLTVLAPELGGKRLELLKEVVPRLSRVAVLRGQEALSSSAQIKEIQVAARALGLQLYPMEWRGGADKLPAAFSAATSARVGALIVLSDPRMLANRHRIAELSIKNRLPNVYQASEFAEAGGLMSYGTNFADLFRRAAIFVDKILKGTKPADLPVEQPTKFEFVINLKTAKQIGLTIPPNVLVRADKVIK
jgi:putative tryptophan/tyrosine transport system substrate-binding protein